MYLFLTYEPNFQCLALTVLKIFIFTFTHSHTQIQDLTGPNGLMITLIFGQLWHLKLTINFFYSITFLPFLIYRIRKVDIIYRLVHLARF